MPTLISEFQVASFEPDNVKIPAPLSVNVHPSDNVGNISALAFGVNVHTSNDVLIPAKKAVNELPTPPY